MGKLYHCFKISNNTALISKKLCILFDFDSFRSKYIYFHLSDAAEKFE